MQCCALAAGVSVLTWEEPSVILHFCKAGAVQVQELGSSGHTEFAHLVLLTRVHISSFCYSPLGWEPVAAVIPLEHRLHKLCHGCCSAQSLCQCSSKGLPAALQVPDSFQKLVEKNRKEQDIFYNSNLCFKPQSAWQSCGGMHGAS